MFCILSSWCLQSFGRLKDFLLSYLGYQMVLQDKILLSNFLGEMLHHPACVEGVPQFFSLVNTSSVESLYTIGVYFHIVNNVVEFSITWPFYVLILFARRDWCAVGGKFFWFTGQKNLKKNSLQSYVVASSQNWLLTWAINSYRSRSIIQVLRTSLFFAAKIFIWVSS